MRFASDLFTRCALAAIRGYRRWLSPYKGFSCAFRVATGGDSCSAYGYRVIERFGLRRGLGLLDRRLALCGHVHRSAQAARGQARPRVRHPLLHYQRGECDPGCDLPCDGIGHGHCCGQHVHRGGCAADLIDICNPCDGCSWDRKNKARKERRWLGAITERVTRQQARARERAKRKRERSG